MSKNKAAVAAAATGRDGQLPSLLSPGPICREPGTKYLFTLPFCYFWVPCVSSSLSNATACPEGEPDRYQLRPIHHSVLAVTPSLST